MRSSSSNNISQNPPRNHPSSCGGERPPATVKIQRHGCVKQEPLLQRVFRGHKGPVLSVDSAPLYRQQCVSGSDDGTVLIWNFKPQLRPIKLIGHTGAVNCVSMSPSGSRVASCSVDRTVRIWENSSKAHSVILKCHTAPIRSVKWSKDERFILSAGDDKSVKMMDANDGKFLSSFLGHTNWVRSAVFSDTGNFIASSGDDRSVRVWDVSMKREISCFYDHGGVVNQVEFHPKDSNCLASCGADRNINLWDLRQKNDCLYSSSPSSPIPGQSPLLQHYTRAHGSSITSIGFHASGNFLISSARDGDICIWDLREGRLLWRIEAHSSSVNSVCFDKETGSSFMSAGSDNVVLSWASNLVEDRPVALKDHHSFIGNENDHHPLRKSAMIQQPDPSPSSSTCIQNINNKNTSALLPPPRAMMTSSGSPSSSPAPIPQIQSIEQKLDLILNSLQSLNMRLKTAEDRICRLEVSSYANPINAATKTSSLSSSLFQHEQQENQSSSPPISTTLFESK